MTCDAINESNYMKPTYPSVRQTQAGMTLVELMIVLVIIAILSVIAYPSYTQFVIKSKRSAAQAMLMQVADRQQQYFLDNKQYASSLTSLNFPENPFMISDEGQFIGAGDSDRIYQIELANTSATGYTAQAVPQLRQAEDDTNCGTLSLTHTGIKNSSKGGENCW